MATERINLDATIGHLADLLGLDTNRARLLKNAYKQAQESLRKLETEMAKVESDDTCRRIIVAPAEGRGKVIQEVWKGHLASILTAAEREKYDKYGGDGAIFVRGFGETQRKIELRRDGDNGTIIDDIGGGGFMSMGKYADLEARFEEEYGHMLK